MFASSKTLVVAGRAVLPMQRAVAGMFIKTRIPEAMGEFDSDHAPGGLIQPVCPALVTIARPEVTPGVT
jgi:hypothetical protein